MVTVQFNFKTILEAQEFLEGLSGRQPEAPPSPKGPMVPGGPSKDSATVAHSAPPISEPQAVVLNPKAKVFIETITASPLPPFVEPAEKKKRGPKPKAEPVKEYGIEDCRNALSSLFDVKGHEVAKSVLTEFKVDRVAYLKPEQFAAFIERCKTAGQPE